MPLRNIPSVNFSEVLRYIFMRIAEMSKLSIAEVKALLFRYETNSNVEGMTFIIGIGLS